MAGLLTFNFKPRVNQIRIKMAQIVQGWLEEKETMWPGQRFSLKLKEGSKLIHEERSEYQHIQLFDSETYGRVLVLDGVIQLTERDEFAYQEMIVHLPMFAHKNPRNVLIVGGGDGGVLREVLNHATVQRVVMCEIDRKVCEVSKKYFPTTMATAFNDPSSDDVAKRTKDPRAQLHYQDAAEFMKHHENEFDVIIVDSSDPVGPAETLYSSDFYANMHKALRPGGVVCTQGECQFLHADLIAKVMGDARALYPVVDYAFSTVPTYPSGQIGYIIAQKSSGSAPSNIRVPSRPVPRDLQAKLRYYNSAIHSAAFVLPAFMANKLASLRNPQTLGGSSSGSAKVLGVEVSPAVVGAIFTVVGAAIGYFVAKRR
jgi:spermidine synthase